MKPPFPKLLRDSGVLPVLAACVIGLAAGASALLLGHGINALGSWRMELCQQYAPILVLPVIGLLGGLLSGLMVWIAPDTSGSGIPQVRAVLNRMNLPLDFRIAIVKLIGGTIALGSGLFMGREGPTVQVGAAIAGQFSRWFPTSIEQRRHLIAAGAAAGLAAAFSAPIAGVVFVVEELLKEFKAGAVALAIVACFSASLVEHVFGHPHKIVLVGEMNQGMTSSLDLLFVILLALTSGFFGALFNRGILLFLRMFKRVNVAKPFKVGFAGLITGLVVACLPLSLHDYAHTRALIDAGSLSENLVVVVFGAFSFLTLLAYGSGAPGGLFAPALSIGSALGYIAGTLESHFVSVAPLHMFALVGMGAFFAAVSRAPLTSIIIVFEMASDFAIVPPLMIACVIASAFGEHCYKGGLYDLLMVWNGLHLHRPGTSEESAGALASDFMDTKIEVLQSGTSLKDAKEMLDRLKRDGLPVVNKGKLVGVYIGSDRPADLEEDSAVTVDSIMVTPPLAISSQDTAEEILFLFARYQFSWLPVTDESDKLIGLVWQKDLIKSVFAEQESDEK
ncbi:MAG: chloride channel protein [Candidatus Melainabacteria bacterium]|nr:chloride channel protein [Candidatus Melainabacteria bacterium]